MSRPSLSVSYSEYLDIKKDNDLLKEQLRHLCEIIKETREENLSLKNELLEENKRSQQLEMQLIKEQRDLAKIKEDMKWKERRNSISKIQAKETLSQLKQQMRTLENFVEEEEEEAPKQIPRIFESAWNNEPIFSFRSVHDQTRNDMSFKSLSSKNLAVMRQKKMDMVKMNNGKINMTIKTDKMSESIVSELNRGFNESLSFKETSNDDWHTAIQDTTISGEDANEDNENEDSIDLNQTRVIY